MNGVDKFVREAMPIQEEEEVSVKPAATAKPKLKPSSTSGSTLMEHRQWIDIEIQKSKDAHCFQVSKFITRLLRHSKQVRRKEGVHYDQIVEECKKKSSDDTGYWSDEMLQQFTNAPPSSLEKWISVLAKGGGQKKRLQPQKSCYQKPEFHGNMKQTFPQGPMIWKVMQRNVWKDIANWRAKQLNSCTDDHQFKEE